MCRFLNKDSLFKDRVSTNLISHPILIEFAPIASSPLNNLFESEALILVLFPIARLAILKPASATVY